MMDDERLKAAHSHGSIAGTIACIRAMIDAKTPAPSGGMGGQLAQGLFEVIERENNSTAPVRNAALKGYCDGIQALMMQHLAPGTHPPLIGDDVELPDNPEIAAAVAELARLTKGK